MAEKEITHEGETYILKSGVEAIISKRISSYAEKLRARETEFESLQKQLDDASGKLGQIDTFQQRITQLEGDLKQANTRYDRHSVLSGIGVNDDSVRATFEHLHSTTAKETPFNDWVNAMKEDPSKAPLILQSFIKPQGDHQGQQQQDQNKDHKAQNQIPNQNQPPQQPARKAPPSNNGVIQTTLGMMGRDEILQRAADPAFYAANRETIKNIYSSGQQATQPRV